MEFSWQILILVFVVNSFWISVMYMAQQTDKNLPARHSIIPGTNQKFLYVQDFWTGWGDLFAVPLIVNAFAHLIVKKDANIWGALIFGLVSVVIFLALCLRKGHKPDQGFPEIGKISLNGIVHLPYLGIGYGASALCIWHLFTGDLRGPVMWIGLAGGALYITCFVAEIRSGNFDSLKRI